MKLNTWFRLLTLPPLALPLVLLALTLDSARDVASRPGFVAAVVVSLIFGVVTPALLARRVVRPLLALTRASSQLANGRFDAPVIDTEEGVGEISELARAFARLASRLGESVAAQREKEYALRTTARKHKLLAERLGGMLASGPAVSFNLTVDVRPRHTFISENVAAHTGYSASAFLSTDTLWASLIHPDDRTSFADSLGLALADGSATQDYRIRHADGGYRRVHGQVRVTFDDAGVPKEFVGWWMEVTADPDRGDVGQSLTPPLLHARR